MMDPPFLFQKQLRGYAIGMFCPILQSWSWRQLGAKKPQALKRLPEAKASLLRESARLAEERAKSLQNQVVELLQLAEGILEKAKAKYGHENST